MDTHVHTPDEHKSQEEQTTCRFLHSQPGTGVIPVLLCNSEELNFTMEVNPTWAERKNARKEILITVSN